MERKRARWRRFLRFGPDEVAEDIEDELSFHREMRERDFIEAGLTPEQARAAAAARLGDLESVRRWLTTHDHRRMRRLAMGETLLELVGDARYGVRKLVQQPGFALAVISVLALGTGATTAIFSAVDAVLLRPLPFADADRLTILDLGPPFDPGEELGRPKGGPDITDARALTDVFTDVASYAPGGLNLSDQVNPRRVRVGVVTPNLFGMLGLAPLHGRVFSAAEESSTAAPVAVLSEGIWRSQFGSDPDVIGREVVLNGKAYEIVGVLPRGFEFPERSEIWLPLSVPFTRATMEPFRSYLPSRSIARLAPGVTVEQAAAAAFALHTPYTSPDRPAETTAAEMVRPLRDALVGQRRGALIVLLGATALVLVVGCANVANLLLTRGTMRRREIALRSVLGATPGRVLRQLTMESLVLAVVGAAVGMAFAFGAIRLLEVLVPTELVGVATLRVDGRVLAFSMALALGTGMLFGLWPALEARRSDAGEALKAQSTAGGSDGRAARLRRAFVVGEVALALMLLVGSTLMLRSLHRLMTAESGVDPDGVATLELTLARADHAGPEGRRRFYEAVLGRLAADPRVEVAAAIDELPMRGVAGIALLMYPEGNRPERSLDVPYTQLVRITPDYFRAMQIRMLAGRAPLPSSEAAGASETDVEEVAISESVARLHWPNRSPLGERLDWPGGKFEIVGVVADVRPTTLESEFAPQAYTAMMSSPDMNGALIVRGRGDPSGLGGLLEDAVHMVAPTQAVYNVRSMKQVIDGAIGTRRTNTFLITAFGALALALASVGVYGVMAFSVARKTREIGIRLALGAPSSRVMGAVLREGAILALIGSALGLGGAWALSRVMEGLLYGVTTRDPLTFVLAPIALLAVTLIAAIVPAWRATRVDPVESIRVE